MSPAERTMLRTLIERARRAQIDAAGGYEQVEKAAAEIDLQVGELAHGTRRRYLRGCRCRPCADANRTYKREWARAHRPVRSQGEVGFLTRVFA